MLIISDLSNKSSNIVVLLDARIIQIYQDTPTAKDKDR